MNVTYEILCLNCDIVLYLNC